MATKPPDLTGQTFNDWTCLGFSENKRGGKRTLYSCRCKCNAVFDLTGSDLQKGKSKRCRACSGLKPKDLIGQTFGHLKVLSKAENLGVKTAWNCLCLHCNEKCVVRTGALVNKTQDGCSCQINYNKIDYSGQVFGRLKVVSKFEKGMGRWYYLCVCSCSKECVVAGGELRRGTTKSCGCLKYEMLVARGRTLGGDKNPNWKGGGCEDERTRIDYKNWRLSVLSRDGNICQICGDDQELEAHHLKSFADNSGHRLDLDNGVCLCHTCHIVFHLDYGYGDNTPEQYASFKRGLGV